MAAVENLLERLTSNLFTYIFKFDSTFIKTYCILRKILIKEYQDGHC